MSKVASGLPRTCRLRLDPVPTLHDVTADDLPPTLERALSGQPLSPEEGYQLIHATGTEVEPLVRVAGLVRDRGRGRRITYSRKVFLPLTNLCRDRCGYCTFVQAPGSPQAHTMTPDEVVAVAVAGHQRGCKEALFSLGDHPEWRHAEARHQLDRLGYRSTPEYLAAMCRLVVEETGLLPHTNAGILSRKEMLALLESNVSMGIMLENVSDRLLERGGPHFGCDSKAPALRLEVLAQAGELGIPMTTGILIGIGETLEERVDSLLAIKAIQERYGHIQEVIIQNFRAKPDTRMRGCAEPSTLDMMRTIAVARLILGGDMNIQAPPNLNADGYQGYLLAGINDWGGISPVTRDYINPEAPWPEIRRLRQLTEESGFELKERLAIYPEYVVSGAETLPSLLRSRVLGLTDEEGYVKEEHVAW